MKVLITGGAGFQGSHLTQAILKQGDTVTILNTLSEEAQKNVRAITLPADKLSVVWGSITDRQTVEKAVREHDIVFHLAANIHVDESRSDPRAYYETNVLGTYNIFDSCRKLKIPIIYVSSCEVYGYSLAPCTERGPLHPRSPYAASKAGADCLMYSHALTFDHPVLILRPTNVFGRRQRGGKRGAVIPRFVSQAVNSESITLYGDGSQRRDFIYIPDLIDAYIFLLNRFVAGGFGWRYQNEPHIFNIGTGSSVSILDVALQINKFFDNPKPIRYLDRRPGEVPSFEIDSNLLEKEGFLRRRSFSECLIEYLRTWRVCS